MWKQKNPATKCYLQWGLKLWCMISSPTLSFLRIILSWGVTACLYNKNYKIKVAAGKSLNIYLFSVLKYRQRFYIGHLMAIFFSFLKTQILTNLLKYFDLKYIETFSTIEGWLRWLRTLSHRDHLIHMSPLSMSGFSINISHSLLFEKNQNIVKRLLSNCTSYFLIEILVVSRYLKIWF